MLDRSYYKKQCRQVIYGNYGCSVFESALATNNRRRYIKNLAIYNFRGIESVRNLETNTHND